MPDLSSPCGVWRLTVRRLGSFRARTDQFGVLARIESDGTVTVFAGGSTAAPSIGAWRSAGPGRVVMLAESFVTAPGGNTLGRLSVRAAAELTGDGVSCRARLQWQRIDLEGRPLAMPVHAEAEGTRLTP